MSHYFKTRLEELKAGWARVPKQAKPGSVFSPRVVRHIGAIVLNALEQADQAAMRGNDDEVRRCLQGAENWIHDNLKAISEHY